MCSYFNYLTPESLGCAFTCKLMIFILLSMSPMHLKKASNQQQHIHLDCKTTAFQAELCGKGGKAHREASSEFGQKGLRSTRIHCTVNIKITSKFMQMKSV